MNILIIDDEEILAKLISAGLKKRGHVCDCAISGESGRQMAEEYPEKYDLIILDLAMPGENGCEVMERLRKNKILTPILVVSSCGAIGKELALKMGADAYLAKPFIFKELLAKIKQVQLKHKPTAEKEINKRLISRPLK